MTGSLADLIVNSITSRSALPSHSIGNQLPDRVPCWYDSNRQHLDYSVLVMLYLDVFYWGIHDEFLPYLPGRVYPWGIKIAYISATEGCMAFSMI